MHDSSFSRLASIALLVIVGATAPTLAQTSLPMMGQPNPGARSLGLGGAFVAQADDATAAYSNPAGLVALIRPEVSGEFRFSIYTDAFDDGINEGDDGDDDVFSLGFLSAVYPIGDFSLAIYRNQFSILDTTTGDTNELFDTFDLTTYGLSGSYRVNDRFSIGLGAAFNDGRFDASTVEGDGDVAADGWGGIAGLIWRLDERWQVGASFRSGPEVEFDTGSHRDSFGFPDIAALGFRFRTLGGALSISGEVDHVWYSRAASIDATVDDSDEYHFGVEYAILSSTPVMAIRFGIWRDPVGDHDQESGRFQAEHHVSTGFGLAMERIQVDFALDYSDTLVTTSVSGIVVF